ncbi:MAG: hypothetical protein C0467_32535 [Planctomycetaceae bacterium]|nr:hypothetical protein [Planctomycetaceae bacterium]
MISVTGRNKEGMEASRTVIFLLQSWTAVGSSAVLWKELLCLIGHALQFLIRLQDQLDLLNYRCLEN